MLPAVTGLHQVSQTPSSDGTSWITVFAWDVTPEADAYDVDVDDTTVTSVDQSSAPEVTITTVAAMAGAHILGVAPTLLPTPPTDLDFDVPPAVPTGLAGVAQSATRVNLTCNPVSGATSYGWYRNGVLLGTTTAPAYSDGSDQPSTTYQYQVDSAVGTVQSALSAAVAVTTPAQIQVPPAPTGLTATLGGTPTAPTVILAWNPSAGATSYDVYRNGVLIASGVT